MEQGRGDDLSRQSQQDGVFSAHGYQALHKRSSNESWSTEGFYANAEVDSRLELA